jgi:hypothetical protein
LSGRKVFVAGEILLASDVNSLLMDQKIMRFADAAARDAAIPSPVHGMFVFRLDDEVLEYFDSANWVEL